MSLQVVVEADGGARGNPGPAGWGAVVRDAQTGEVLLERADAIGIATNNIAEYQGLIAGLAAAAELSASTVEVRMDSKLVVEQMAGRWRIKHPGLRPLAAQAAGLVRRFDSVSWQWVPRERNRHADRLANEAMDAAAQKLGKGRGPTTGPTPEAGPAGRGEPGPTGGEAGPAGRGEAGPAGRREPGEATGGGPGNSGGGSGPTGGSEPRTRSSWEPPDTPPTRLLLVRHGETPLNAQSRYSGRGDVPLSPAGLAQAEAVARRIAALAPKLTAVVSSPLARCTATAAAIAAATGEPPVATDPDLIECDLGEWEGQSFQRVRERWPAQLDAWHTSTSAAPPGGESLQQVAMRVRRAVATLRKAYPGSVVAVVSHVWPLKVMLRDALGAGDPFLQRLLLAPTGLSVVDTYPDGTVAVHSVNDTAHLPAPGG